MYDKHYEKQVHAVIGEIIDVLELLVNKIDILNKKLVDLEKQHEQLHKEAYNKGYRDAVLMSHTF